MVEKVRFKCTSCGCKFTRNIEAAYNKLCPYCGKTTIEKHAFSEADELISSVVDVEEMFDK